MKEMGWEPPVTIEDSLAKVVEWTLENPQWLYEHEKEDKQILGWYISYSSDGQRHRY